MKTNETKICRNKDCNKNFDPSEIARIYGNESAVLSGGFCSAKCYTHANIKTNETKQPTHTQGELLREDSTLYILHPSGNFKNGFPEYCNKFTMSVQPDYGRGLKLDDAIKYAVYVQKCVNMHDELVYTLDELTKQVERYCSIGSDPRFMEMLQIHQKAKQLIIKQAEQE